MSRNKHGNFFVVFFFFFNKLQKSFYYHDYTMYKDVGVKPRSTINENMIITEMS